MKLKNNKFYFINIFILFYLFQFIYFNLFILFYLFQLYII